MAQPRTRRSVLFVSGGVVLWAGAVAALVLAEAAWGAAPAVRRGDPASIERHMAGALADAVAGRRIGSAALALLHHGEVVTERGFGVADATRGSPVDPGRTLYLTASVSKAVTAWGVMKLVQQGRLGLDEPVLPRLARWRFAGSEPHAGAVTVRHLLSHTAGLDDGLGYRVSDRASPSRAWRSRSACPGTRPRGRRAP